MVEEKIEERTNFRNLEVRFMETPSAGSDLALPNKNGHGGKYLTFHLDNEEYGIGIIKIREIIKMMKIRSIPRTPDYIKGVINLRGEVIPVMDISFVRLCRKAY